MDYNPYNKILLIEDNPGDTRLVELYLAESDLFDSEIHTRVDLTSGIEALHKDHYDAVLLDLTLPDSRGFETLEKLLAQVPDVNVIVLTGLTNKEIGIKSVKAGAQDFLVKGAFDSEILAKSLRYSIERSQVLKRLEEAQSIAHIGSWEYKIHSKEFSASDELYRIFGYLTREYIITEEDLNNEFSHFYIFGEVHQEAKERGAVKKDVAIYQKDGKERHISIQCKAIKDTRGELIALNGIIQDITERKEAEQFREDQEKAKLKEQFLAQVSHDMRTPVSAIIYNLILGIDEGLNSEQYQRFQAMRTNADYLLSMINDILDFQALQYGEVSFEQKTFDFHKVMNNLFVVIQNKLAEKKLEFELSKSENIPPFLAGDKHRLTRVLINLTGNAIKFTHNGYVKVRVEEIGRTEKDIHLKFSVEDSGIGIPEDKLEAIFGAFNRVKHEDEFFEGTGLGLSIVKNIVEKQGGQVGVTSTLRKGSTFFFDLKFGIAEAPKEQKVELPSILSSQKSFSILLAEDNKSLSIPTKGIIERNLKNVKVQIVENGKEVIEALEKEKFDIILMDIQMPVMNGIEASRYIREKMPDEVKNIPIIAMTAEGYLVVKERFEEFGMNDFIIKPFPLEILYEKIGKYLK